MAIVGVDCPLVGKIKAMNKTMIKLGSLATVLFVLTLSLSSKIAPPPPDIIASVSMPVCTQTTGVTQSITLLHRDTLIERTKVIEIKTTNACSNQTGVAKIWDGAILVSQATFSDQDLPIHLGTGDPNTVPKTLTAEVFWTP